MNKGESETMSFPSDILSQEDQAEIFRDLSDFGGVVVDIDGIFHDPTSNVTIEEENFIEKDFKMEPTYITMSTPEQMVPPLNCNVLSNEGYLGPFEFEVDIHPNGSKNPWVHSPMLNKIFMDMNSPFPVDFRLKRRPENLLFIRVTPVYSLAQHSQDFVYRCINHEHSMDKANRNVAEHVRQHIIRCSNNSAVYVGDKNKNERLSVIIPFSVPQTGTDSVREIFHFVCKNSCPTPGMNRRPIEIIFTLEDIGGNILGRQTLRVRICSCPKRDKEKEEKEHGNSAPVPKGKKRKVEKMEKKPSTHCEVDTKKYTITLSVIGKQNAQKLIELSHDLMAGEMLRQGNNGNIEPYKNCIQEINNLMNKPLEETK